MAVTAPSNLIVRMAQGRVQIQGETDPGAKVLVKDVSMPEPSVFETTANSKGFFKLGVDVQPGDWAELTAQRGAESASTVQRLSEPHDATAPFYRDDQVDVQRSGGKVTITGDKLATEPFATVTFRVETGEAKPSTAAPPLSIAGGWTQEDEHKLEAAHAAMGEESVKKALFKMGDEQAKEFLLLVEKLQATGEQYSDHMSIAAAVDEAAMRVLGRSICGVLPPAERTKIVTVKADELGRFQADIPVQPQGLVDIHVDTYSTSLHCGSGKEALSMNRDVAVYTFNG